MTIGKPGVVIITDDAGTWTAGDAVVDVNGTPYTQSFDTDKDTSMTALAAQLQGDSNVLTAVYNSTAHTITITPNLGKQLFVESDLSGITGTMTFSIATTAQYTDWATGVGVLAEPSSGKKASGWVADEKPPAFWMNWIQNLQMLWHKYFDDYLDQHGYYEYGSFDAVFPNTMFTVEQTVTVRWRKENHSDGRPPIVRIEFPYLVGTSNGVNMYAINCVPAKILPTAACGGFVSKPCVVQDDGDFLAGACRIQAFNSAIDFSLFKLTAVGVGATVEADDSAPTGPEAGYTNSGTKGVQPFCFEYPLI